MCDVARASYIRTYKHTAIFSTKKVLVPEPGGLGWGPQGLGFRRTTAMQALVQCKIGRTASPKPIPPGRNNLYCLYSIQVYSPLSLLFIFPKSWFAHTCRALQNPKPVRQALQRKFERLTKAHLHILRSMKFCYEVVWCDNCRQCIMPGAITPTGIVRQKFQVVQLYRHQQHVD